MIDINKRIFITGATGFIWANLIHELVRLGATDIHILTRERSNLSRVFSVLEKLHVHFFSLEKREETLEKIKEISPQIIFHIAALWTAVWRVPATIDNLIQLNSLGTIHLIDAAFENGCECFVNTGSSSEYGIKDEPMSEDMLLEPNNLYALSKSLATNYATFRWKTQNMPIVTYRVFSAYGPLEDSSRLIPTLLNTYKSKQIPELSRPDSVRDFIFVWDIIRAYLHADRAIKTPWDIINLWTWIERNIDDVVQIIKKISASDINPIYGNKKISQTEPEHWVAKNEKMKRILEINPISLEEWLEITYSHSHNN